MKKSFDHNKLCKFIDESVAIFANNKEGQTDTVINDYRVRICATCITNEVHVDITDINDEIFSYCEFILNLTEKSLITIENYIMQEEDKEYIANHFNLTEVL